MAVKYRLTHFALWHIRHLSPGIKNILALKLQRCGSTIDRYIRDNGKTDALTKEPALEVLRRVTGLADNQIIEDIKASQN